MKRTNKARSSAILPTASESVNDSAAQEESPPSTTPSDREEVMSNRLSIFGGLGGFDGIMSMMGSAQKFFSFFQQMQPMIKMAGSLLGPKAVLSSVAKPKTQPKKTANKSRAAASAHKKTKRK